VPRYGFPQHRRLPEGDWVWTAPRPVILVEGLLVLAEPSLVNRFDLAVFVAAPPEVRLARRTERDQRERGRSPASVQEQFHRTVEPMHQRFVEPSAAQASLRLDGTADPNHLVQQVLRDLHARGWWSPAS
jgi:uridine kinase